jgi:predicted RNase H-like HicB family nuclease
MKARFTYWKESDGRYLGYLNDYPDHWTQGENLDDLKEHLKDLFHTFSAEEIPGIRKVEELESLEAARAGEEVRRVRMRSLAPRRQA